MLFVLFAVLSGFGHAINTFLDTKWGTLLILGDLIKTIWMRLFHADQMLPESVARALLQNPLPVAACWAALAAVCALATWLFGLRIRAQETVR